MRTFTPPTLPDAVPLDHHLSLLARSRMSSPLKGLYRYFNKPGMLMLAGGLPAPDYFPFESISARVLEAETFKPQTSALSLGWLWSLIGNNAPPTTKVTVPKYAATPKDPMSLQLSTALQYGTATGLPALAAFIQDFTARVYQPGYRNFETLMNAGSTDAWGKIASTLCERGDGILCEEWTYPSALGTVWPTGVKPVALPMDGAGMTPEGMEAVLSSWNPDEHDGMPRPRVLYTVPVCQNPTGATMPAERKKAIYEIAVKYDVIIVEDDPYYFLQAGEYESAQARKSSSSKEETDEEFLASLIPSYLRYDYQGRVIRIDTFSKTIAPGSRLGWTTAQPILIERLTRANESSTQSASGFAQVLIAKLLVEEWGYSGFLQWLKGLKAEYRARRDLLVDCLLHQADAALDARASTESNLTKYSLVLPAPRRMRDEKGFLLEKQAELKDTTVLSFVAPEGGMFVWLRVHTSQHPSYPAKSTAELIQALWEDIAENNVLIAPGTMFSGRDFGKAAAFDEVEADPFANVMEVEGDGFFRISFSTASESEMTTAMAVVGKVVKKFWLKKF